MGRGQELLDAAREGDRRTVEKILGNYSKRSGPFTSLRRGAGPNVQDDNGYTPLHHACLNSRPEIVRLLLQVDASPCIVDKKGATALHLAAFRGDAEVVRMLLAHENPRVNIDQRTADHETALLIAAQFGYLNVVTQLVRAGADITLKNKNDESPLDLAAQYGRLSTVQHLLEIRPQLVEQYKYPMSRAQNFTNTPLHRASKNGRRDVVKALIDAGMDPNVKTQHGTPLHEAARFGKASVVRILLRKGADLNTQDANRKNVYDLLAEYPPEATRKVMKVIRDVHENYNSTVSTEYENQVGYHDSDEDVPPFPVPDSPTGTLKATTTENSTNQSNSNLSSHVTKYHPQSFVKKLASRCLGLKAKFNSAPNISNTSVAEVDVKTKLTDNKSNTSTLLIGNSKFFKMLSKKEESGEIVCNDEFDTISLDRLGTLNRDNVVNRSNRSCPGFKTSLPNISENNELSESEFSESDSVHISSIASEHKQHINDTVNYDVNLNIFEPRETGDRNSVTSNISMVNECYESYECKTSVENISHNNIPKPPPRLTVNTVPNNNDNNIYENVVLEIKTIPKPAVRTNVPNKQADATPSTLYENVTLSLERKIPEPPKRTIIPEKIIPIMPNNTSTLSSMTSSASSDSMLDETNLEDILLSKKSKSFRHRKTSSYSSTNRSQVGRTQSNASDSSNYTEASALENVDCSDIGDKSIYLSMTGTLPNNKTEQTVKKKVLFRHKTFTNIEADRNSIKVRDLPQWDNEFMKETLASYHIRGTGHCIYNAPTVEEFIYIFNREKLYRDVPPFTKLVNPQRDSYFETAICFCRQRPPKFHNSAEDLLDKTVQGEESKVTIDVEALQKKCEMSSSSFQCYCDSASCTLHSIRRKLPIDLVVKFSAIKRSISTPDITLDSSPISTAQKKLHKNKSVPHKLEEPYAVVDVGDIIARNQAKSNDPPSPIYTPMSHPSTLSSSASAGPYSLKDIAEVISLNDSSTSTATDSSRALQKSSSSECSGHWSLQSCNSNVTIKSDASFKTCLEESESSDDGTLHSEAESSDAETVKSDVSTGKRPWVHSDSFRFGADSKPEFGSIVEEKECESLSSSGICLEGSESSSSGCDDDSGVPREGAGVLDCASLERGVVWGGVRSGSRRRWDEAEGTSEGDALSVSSAASSCAPLHLHHHGYSKVSGPKHYLKHGRSVDQYVDGKLSYSEYEENHNPRVPVPNPRPSIKQRSQPVAITAMYENIVIKEQNPRRKLRRSFVSENEQRMGDRVRKYSNQERSSLESLLDDQSMNSPSDCERYYDGQRVAVPLSPTHYVQPPTPDHPPPSAKQAENCIHERIRPLSQLIMEVVEEIRIRKMSQGDIKHS